jgi:CNT family concentrative nucleoside transporter
MTAPGTIMMAKMFIPESEEPKTAGSVKLRIERTDVNLIDAAARGCGRDADLVSGPHRTGQCAAWARAAVGGRAPEPGMDLRTHRGAACMAHGGSVEGQLRGGQPSRGQLSALKDTLDPRSFVIATFALCGFANVSSIGIQLGGIGALAPDRKHDLASLGFRAVAAGTLANYLSASIAGILL